MKKSASRSLFLYSFLALFLALLFTVVSCPEGRTFTHFYYYIPTKISDDGEIIADCNSSNVFEWRYIELTFSSSDEVGYYFDIASGNRKKVQDYKDENGVECIRSFAINSSIRETSNNSLNSGLNYTLTGSGKSTWKFKSWKVIKNKEFVDYNGMGQENLFFYPEYEKVSDIDDGSSSDSQDVYYTHKFYTIPTDIDQISGEVIAKVNADNKFTWELLIKKFKKGDNWQQYINLISQGVKGFISTGDILISSSDNRYTINVSSGKLYEFARWKVLNNNQLINYNGDGLENLDFYATYNEIKTTYTHTYYCIDVPGHVHYGKICTDNDIYNWTVFYKDENFTSSSKLYKYSDNGTFKDIILYPAEGFQIGTSANNKHYVTSFIVNKNANTYRDIYSTDTPYYKIRINSGSSSNEFEMHIFDNWKIYKDGHMIEYTGDGLEDLVFYATYKKEEY